MDEPILKIQEITKTYNPDKLNEVCVLKGVSLTLKKGEIVGLLAPSGAGKSTLIFISGLIESPDEGVISIAGTHVHKVDDQVRTKIRRQDIGIVYQFHHLLPEFSAVENVMVPQLANGVVWEEAQARAQALLASVALHDRYNHKPSELSGGEQQRVSLCRSLANSPKLLLADEPTGNLDSKTSQHVFELLLEKVKILGMGALVATHNEHLSKQMDRVIYLENGKLINRE